MFKTLALTAATSLAFISFDTVNTKAGYGYGCYCPCRPSVTSSAPEAMPPAAPAEGETQQSQSVEPQAAPPAAPPSGTTYRNYSVQPAPAYRYQAPRTRQRVPFEPEQRKQHPTNRFLW